MFGRGRRTVVSIERRQEIQEIEALPPTQEQPQPQPQSVVIPVTPPRYFMDSPTEGNRLELKTDPIEVGRHLLLTGLRQGMQAVDVGCGTGAVTRVMARITGPQCVTGVDGSAERLDQARAVANDSHLGVTFVQGTAHALPLPDNCSVYTHSRMLFQYLTRPEDVLAEMIRITQPGGKIVLVDLDGQIDQLYPMNDLLHRDLRDALQILNTLGFDPHAGRKLATLCAHAGLERIQSWVEPYQVYVCGRLTERDLRNWEEKLHTATGFLAKETGDVHRWERFRDNYLASLQAQESFYYATIIIVRGVVPR